MAKSFNKDPNANLDYEIDWQTPTKPYLAVGETIVDSSWTVSPVGLTMGADLFTNTTTTIWLSGGTVDTRYTVSNKITTSTGRIDERSFYVYITELFL